MKENDRIMERISEIEDEYWWYTGRREILKHILSSLLDTNSRVLNVGCGTGSDSLSVSEFGAEVFNTDYSLTALVLNRRKGNEKHFRADCIQLPLKAASLDLVMCLDVIEHVERDIEAMDELRRVLDPSDGRLLLTVPAYNWMWTSRDDVAGHFRRYSKKKLKKVLHTGGFEIIFCSYFNTFLFSFMLADFILDHLRKARNSENTFPEFNRKVNTILRKILSFERHFLIKPGLPFGKSIICLCRPRKIKC